MHFPLFFVLLAVVGALVAVGAGCAPGPENAIIAPTGGAAQDSMLSYGDDIKPVSAPIAPREAPPADASVGQGSGTSTGFPGRLPAERIAGKQVRMQTSKGEIVFELFDEDAPLTVSNFVALAERGFYDGLTFHRVVPGFVIQGGDPEGTGMGGPGYKFEDEPVRRDYDAGIVAMANSGPDTNGSQFFIVLEDQPTLPKDYTIFGRVTSGMEAVRAIRMGDTMTTVTVEAR